MGQILMIARTNDDARLAVGVERRVVLARSDLVAKASMGMSCFGTMYTYLVRRSRLSLTRIESDGDGLPQARTTKDGRNDGGEGHEWRHSRRQACV